MAAPFPLEVGGVPELHLRLEKAFVLRQALLNQHVVAVVIARVLADARLISLGGVGFGRVVEGRPRALAVTRWLGAGFVFASLTRFVLLGFGARLLSRAWRYLEAGLGTATLALALSMATSAPASVLVPGGQRSLGAPGLER